MTEKSRSLSISDFRMWLEGVEEMQPADWSPDANQWAKIREKINCIDDSLPGPPQIAPAGVIHREPIRFATEDTPPKAPQNIPLAPKGSTGLAAPVGPISNANLATQPNVAVKTPDINTDGQPYRSSFA